METLDTNQTPPVFVMSGVPTGPGKLVFLHGMCGHGLGYAQAFQFSAAKWGTLIAPQGDIPTPEQTMGEALAWLCEHSRAERSQ